MLLQVLIFRALGNVLDTSQICIGLKDKLDNLKHLGIKQLCYVNIKDIRAVSMSNGKNKKPTFFLSCNVSFWAVSKVQIISGESS